MEELTVLVLGRVFSWLCMRPSEHPISRYPLWQHGPYPGRRNPILLRCTPGCSRRVCGMSPCHKAPWPHTAAAIVFSISTFSIHPSNPPPKKTLSFGKKTHTKKTPSAYLNPKTLISPLHLLSQPGGDMQVMVSPTGKLHGKDSFRQSCFSFLSPITSPKSPGPSQPLQQPGLLQAHQWLVGSCWPNGTSEMDPPLGRRHRVAQAVSLWPCTPSVQVSPAVRGSHARMGPAAGSEAQRVQTPL